MTKTAMSSEDQAIAERLTLLMHRHFVIIYLEIKDVSSEVKRTAYSAFLFSLDGQWLVCSAGHCFVEVEYLLERGASIERCYLIDAPQPNTRYLGAIAFNWRDARPWFVYDKETGVDYGALFIDDNVRRLLEAGGKVAAEPPMFGGSEPNPLCYAIYGVPKFTTKMTQEFARMQTHWFLIRDVVSDPDLSYEPKVKTFFGNLPSGSGKIEGMSGGPVFALFDNRYCLYAVQSWQNGRLVGAPLVGPMADLIRQELTRRRHPTRSETPG